MHHEHRPEGWGVDRSDDRRPGVPFLAPPQPAAGAHADHERQQVGRTRVTSRMELDELTPVFGTVAPPKALSGLLRRAAYRVPEHKARHWLVLLMADQVDVLEHRLGAKGGMILAGGMVLAGGVLLRRVLTRARALATPERRRRLPKALLAIPAVRALQLREA
jgi:hypothetical protein